MLSLCLVAVAVSYHGKQEDTLFFLNGSIEFDSNLLAYLIVVKKLRGVPFWG